MALNNTTLLLWKAVVYRAMMLFAYSIMFGFKVGLIATAVASFVYFLFDWAFAKLFHIRREHEGGVIWLTGLPCSGKTTVAKEAIRQLEARGKRAYLLDGDEVRKDLCADLGFSPEDRKENLRRVTFLANTLADNGVIVFCAFVSPNEQVRQEIKLATGAHMVWVHATPWACENRDVKGMWAKARAGDLPYFTGVGAPYEIPERPDLALDTQHVTPEESANTLIRSFRITTP